MLHRLAIFLLCFWTMGCDPAPTESPQKKQEKPEIQDVDGWDDAPGTGPFFNLDRFGMCEPTETINQAWAPLLDLINQQMAEGVVSGRMLAAAELAGLRADYKGEDPAITMKFYVTNDPDGDPTNNYCRGAGCGEMVVDENFMEEGQTIYRANPAPIKDFKLTTNIDRPLAIDLSVGEVLVRNVVFGFTAPQSLEELIDGTLEGVATAHDLNTFRFNLCDLLPAMCIALNIPEDTSGAVLLWGFNKSPDVDLDGDGLETYEVTDWEVSRCVDGDGTVIEGQDCLDDPRMKDGFSTCFFFHALKGVMVSDQ